MAEKKGGKWLKIERKKYKKKIVKKNEKKMPDIEKIGRKFKQICNSTTTKMRNCENKDIFIFYLNTSRNLSTPHLNLLSIPTSLASQPYIAVLKLARSTSFDSLLAAMHLIAFE